MKNPLSLYKDKHRKTDAALAEMTGYSRSYITGIVAGDRLPGRAAIERMADVTDGEISPAAWFDWLQSQKVGSAA